ncbi:MAG: rod shape-determining protein [Desulfobacterales bacterium]
MFKIFRRIIEKPNMAIDLGTANTRIHACEEERMTEEPSLVRNIRQSGENSDAYIAYLNSKLCSFPLRGGVITDINSAVRLLTPLFKKVSRGLRHPVLLACAPTDTSEKERKVLAEVILRSGASHVAIIPEPWAAAIGADLDVAQPYAQVLVDIGEGVTDMAVIREGRLIYTCAMRTACAEIHKAIRRTVVSRHKIYLYPAEIERLLRETDAGIPLCNVSQKRIRAKGMHIAKRREESVEVSQTDVLGAMEPVISAILKMIRGNLCRLPEHIGAEITESGICLTGGGSCIKGLNSRIAAETGLHVKIGQDPVYAVIKGASRTVRYWKDYDCWWNHIEWPSLCAPSNVS